MNTLIIISAIPAVAVSYLTIRQFLSTKYFIGEKYKMAIANADNYPKQIDRMTSEMGLTEVNFWQYHFHKFEKEV